MAKLTQLESLTVVLIRLWAIFTILQSLAVGLPYLIQSIERMINP